MDRQTIDRFRTRARRVELPADVYESVIDELRIEKGDHARHTPRRPHRAITRRAVVGAGLATAGAAAAFLALSVILRPDEQDPAKEEMNFFTLTAYAEGTPSADGTVIAKQMVSESGSRGGSDDLGWYAAHTFDFDVTGTGVGTIAYSIEGPYVRQPPTEETITEPSVYLDFIHDGSFYEQEGGDHPVASGTYNSFTVEYANQSTEQELLNRIIWTVFPSDDELDTLHQEQENLWAVRQANETYESILAALRASNAFQSLIERRSADLIAQTTLVLTVTFEDGDTQTKRYTITPRDDFDEIVAERDEKSAEYAALIEFYRDDPAHEEEVEAARLALEELHASTPDLYALTETVA